jgi:hypothetical protein
MDRPVRPVLRFQTTAKASADARALGHMRLVQLDHVIDVVALVLAGVFLATGNPLGVPLGVLLAVIAVASLLSSRFHPLQRALLAFRFRGVLGHTTEVVVDDDGLHYGNPLGSSFVPWSSMTTVRANSRTVGFLRRNVLVGYIPSVAFDSPESQASLVAFARSRIQARE